MRALMRNDLTTISAIWLLIVAGSALADPPPMRPDKYVKSLPEHQWVFAKVLWGDKEPCTADSCMGGIYSPPLMLSVWYEKDSNDDKHSIEAAATVDGCEPLGVNLMWEKDYESLKLRDRATYVKDRVRSLIEKMIDTCKKRLDEPVSLDPLDRFFSN
jgi:hypothetical protein